MADGWKVPTEVLAIIILLCVDILVNHSDAQSTTDLDVQDGIRLFEYKDFSSIRLVHFTVPIDTYFTSLKLVAKKTKKSCPDRNVELYLQHGSYPIVNPYNSSFPEDFNLGESSLIKVNGVSTKLPYHMKGLSRPHPGQWYGAAFILKEHDNINVPGLSKTCAYLLFTTVLSVQQADNIPAVPVDTGSIQFNLKTTRSYTIAKFYLPKNTYHYEFTVKSCQTYILKDKPADDSILSYQSRAFSPNTSTVSSNASCPVIFYIRGGAFPPIYSHVDTYILNCSSVTNDSQCAVKFNSPLVDTWYYVIAQNSTPGINDIDVQVEINTKHCVDDNGLFIPAKSQCTVSNYGRHSTASGVVFMMHTQGIPTSNTIYLQEGLPKMVAFTLGGQIDIGGTLHIELNRKNTSAQNSSIELCMQHNTMPDETCENRHSLLVNTTSGTRHMYIPYPAPGRYYVRLVTRCYTVDNNSAIHYETCQNTTAASVYIRSEACVDDGCGRYGDCLLYNSPVFYLTTCRCKLDWRGYGCTDGSQAIPDWKDHLEVYLLVFSNLFFLPAICLSLYRRMFVQALVYTFNMFFSSFYHACDGNRLTSWCLVKYDTLSFCDYYGSILSFCVTIIAMIKCNDKITVTAYMVATLFLAFGVSFNRHALWVFLSPVVVYATCMIISWIYCCVSRKSLFPRKMRWLIMSPGFLLAGTGLCIFALAETDDNYPYTHSAWHMCISLCIVFLLPPTPRKSGISVENSESGSDSTSLESISNVHLLSNPCVNNDDDDVPMIT